MTDAQKHIDDMKSRLDDVEDEIDEARQDAQDVLPKRPKETFVQEGTVDTEDVDNTIVPPG